MELKIKRSQELKGLLSKTVQFQLGFRVQFTPEEQSLIQKYKLGSQVLTPLAMDGWEWHLTCDAAERGDSITCKNVGSLVQAEALIKGACRDLYNFLQVAQSFDGREIVTDFSEAKA